MNWDIVEGNWNQWKGFLKEKWGDLTDDELQQLDGRRDQLAGLLQEKYGIAREKADQDLDEWVSTYNDKVHR